MEYEKNGLALLWQVQAEQQEELGLDPANMSDVERSLVASELCLGLHEEVSELAKLSQGYKKHLLQRHPPDMANAADAVADVLKMTLAIAQLYGLTYNQTFDAFVSKTEVVSSRARSSRLQLEKEQKLICVDLDDTVCDLSKWRKENGHGTSDDLGLQEILKEKFYKSGGFRDLEPIAGAPEALRLLHQLGYKIAFLTARPQWQFKRLHSDTIFWLEKYKIPYDTILFNKDKAEAYYDHLYPAKPVFFVEDMERNAVALADIGISVLLYTQVHNSHMRNSERITRVHSWMNVLDAIGVRHG